MNCTEWENAVIEGLAGDRDVEHQSELAAHLRSCPACVTKAEEYARLSEGLADLREAYARTQPPFVFEPAEPQIKVIPKQGPIRIFVRMSLATAAILALVCVLWPTQTARESAPRPQVYTSTPRGKPNPIPAPWRTPRIWPGTGKARLSTGPAEARVPALPKLVGPGYPGGDRARFRTPSLIIQRRRLTNVDDPQSRFDSRDGLPDRRAADA